MVSSAGETAHLVGRVRPSDARGAVERWLKELEVGMRESMKDYARRALTAYSEDDRLEWMVSWPAQTAQGLLWHTVDGGCDTRHSAYGQARAC